MMLLMYAAGSRHVAMNRSVNDDFLFQFHTENYHITGNMLATYIDEFDQMCFIFQLHYVAELCMHYFHIWLQFGGRTSSFKIVLVPNQSSSISLISECGEQVNYCNLSCS